jgi:hypothetical protein
MPKRSSNLLIICTALLILSCSSTNKIQALKPEPDDAIPLVYKNTPSFINLPINIKLKDIQNQTNILLNGLIYEDNNIEDDGIEMKVWKLAPISIVNDSEHPGEKIKTILPLKAIVRYRFGTTKMGVKLYDTREFSLNGVITLVSEVGLTNWKLNTATQLQSLDWNESPTMTVFGKKIPVTYLINPGVQLFKSKIEKKIDDAIAKSLDFKPNVLAALEKICAPVLMSDTYKSWLRIVPIEIYSTNTTLKKDSFILEMGMKCNVETIIGTQPETKFNASKIILRPVATIPKDITANIVAVSTYQEASKIMTKNFTGQEFSSGSKKVKVHNVSIWHKTGKMIIALEVAGSINGTIYLSGLPKYNEQTKEIYFDQLAYVLDTKNKLIRTASWLAQGFVLRKIEQSCRYSLKPNLEEGKQNLLPYLKNYSPMQGVFINGDMEEIEFQRIQLTNQAIIAFLKVKGTIDVSVNGLK